MLAILEAVEELTWMYRTLRWRQGRRCAGFGGHGGGCALQGRCGQCSWIGGGAGGGGIDVDQARRRAGLGEVQPCAAPCATIAEGGHTRRRAREVIQGTWSN
jgi:hypothetical protein